MKNKILKDLKTLVLAIALAAGVLTVSAWNGPISSPPQGNAYAPINTTAASQTKSGSIWASGFFTTGGGYFGGDVGIGTQAPEARLDVRSGSCYYKLQTEGFYTNCSVNTPTLLTISSDTANYNIATALGNPTSAKNVVLTINSGVKVYSNSTSQPALDTGTLPAGSTVKIVNNGYIVGRGGDGGSGGTIGSWNGKDGSCGGRAINVYSSISTTIDNSNGYIFGGGGGGGGSGATANGTSVGGSGGGGGAGYGVGGPAGNGFDAEGVAGQPGTINAGGSGGSGAGSSTNNPGTPAGDGGGSGGSGVSGSASPEGLEPGGTGGCGGSAASLNGNTITWLGGNNSTQVKGAVQ